MKFEERKDEAVVVEFPSPQATEMDDLESVPPAKVIITAEGGVVVSGIDPLRWSC